MTEQHPDTKAIRTQTGRTDQKEHSTPMFMTSSFVFDSAEHARAMFADEAEGNIYSRYSNPNTDEFTAKMCTLEEAEAGIATGSGMAAVFSSLAALLEQGDHVLACSSLFGCTIQVLNSIFSKWGITTTYVDINKIETWESHIQDNTKIIFLETPSNPGLDLIDLEWVCNLARDHNLITIIDNCFATPYLQKPMNFGADIVVHSATKFIDGQGRGVGGVIVGREKYIEEILPFTKNTGPALSPFNAWIFSKSLETLSVRMDRHCSNALELASFLEDHPNVDWVKYPFLPSHPQYELAKKQMAAGGGVIAFNVSGGFDKAKAFLDKLDMLTLSANLGDTRTIATHPASTTHSSLSEEERDAVNITPGLIRIAVGLEDIDDIKKDVDQALEN
jgi:O-succinylhomoserine sulfhydrylase